MALPICALGRGDAPPIFVFEQGEAVVGLRVHRSTGCRPSGLVCSGRRQGVASAAMRGPRLSTWRLIRFRRSIFDRDGKRKRGPPAFGKPDPAVS